MKKIIIVCVLMVISGIARSQSMATSTNWENNDNSRRATGTIAHDNEFANTEINVENGRVTLSELPELKKATWAIVTNAEGDVITQKRVTPNNNGMDLHRLSKGEMYFLTLIYKNKSQKAFVLHL